ncbi:hypothetical protein HKD37_01G000811 [Glycine soja]|nr:hypothetical protein GmHk_01G000840 [Glycine max]
MHAQSKPPVSLASLLYRTRLVSPIDDFAMHGSCQSNWRVPSTGGVGFRLFSWLVGRSWQAKGKLPLPLAS